MNEKKEKKEEKDYFPDKDENEIVASLRVNLKKRLANDLEFVKQYHGIVSDSDMARYLIRKEKRRIKKEEM
jgi:hypothetical protein